MSIACQLTDIGFPITVQLLARAIRIKMLESWNTLKTVLANTRGMAQTSKGVISQVLAKEHHRMHAAGGDVTVYYAKAAPKRKKKHENKCFYCKNKGHTTSECHKCEQEEKLSRSNLALNTSSGKTLGKSMSGKSSSAKSSSQGLSSRTSNRTTDSAKIVAADSDSDTSSDSDDTV